MSDEVSEIDRITQNIRKVGAIISRNRPSSPIPLETMIEEMARDGWILHGGYSEARPEGQEYVFWLTGAFRDGGTLLEDGPEASGASAHEALERLHAAWRERRNDG